MMVVGVNVYSASMVRVMIYNKLDGVQTFMAER